MSGLTRPRAGGGFASESPAPTPSRARRPAWLWAVSAAWLAVGFGCLLRGSWAAGGDDRGLLGPACWVLGRAAECAALVWAARRTALARRVRQALWLVASACCLSAVLTLPFVGGALGWTLPPGEWLPRIFLLSPYLIGLVGVLRMPMVALPDRVARWEFALDQLASILGVAAVVAGGFARPGFEQPNAAGTSVGVGVVQLLTAIALNVFLLRGAVYPSARAFSLVAVLGCGNLLGTSLYQFPGLRTAAVLVEWLASLSAFWAAAAYAHDPIGPATREHLPRWLRALNPLPVMALVAVLALLIGEASASRMAPVQLLAIASLAVSVVLVLRLVTTADRNLRFATEKAAMERRFHQMKDQSVKRLAGGIAHAFNNLMTVVIGRAELGAAEVPERPDVRETFFEIVAAARRAAHLTHQLLAYTGQEMRRPVRIDVLALASKVIDRIRPKVGPRIQVGIDLSHREPGSAEHGLWVRGDAEQLDALLQELVHNAVRAMPDGGAVTIRVASRVLDAPITEAALPVPSGEHVMMEVNDEGVGATPEVLSSMFEPFFTTQPSSVGLGLGLAAVHGIVAVHKGGIVVRGDEGRGLSVAVFLPRDAAAGPSEGVPAA
jgi:signal transduction histidine kinase